MSDVNSDYSACESAYSDGSYASCTFEADWDDDNDKRKRRLATPAFLGFFLEGWGIIMNYENSTILRLKLVKGWIPCIEYNVRC